MALYKLAIGIALGIILGVGGIALAVGQFHHRADVRRGACLRRIYGPEGSFDVSKYTQKNYAAEQKC